MYTDIPTYIHMYINRYMYTDIPTYIYARSYIHTTNVRYIQYTHVKSLAIHMKALVPL